MARLPAGLDARRTELALAQRHERVRIGQTPPAFDVRAPVRMAATVDHDVTFVRGSLTLMAAALTLAPEQPLAVRPELTCGGDVPVQGLARDAELGA